MRKVTFSKDICYPILKYIKTNNDLNFPVELEIEDRLTGRYLRALVFHPEVHADEGTGADDVGAGVVRGAVALEVARHGGLAPLGPVQLGRQRQWLPLKSDVVHAALGEVGVHLEGPDSRVLGLAPSVHSFLLVHCHQLVARELETVVVPEVAEVLV